MNNTKNATAMREDRGTRTTRTLTKQAVGALTHGGMAAVGFVAEAHGGPWLLGPLSGALVLITLEFVEQFVRQLVRQLVRGEHMEWVRADEDDLADEPDANDAELAEIVRLGRTGSTGRRTGQHDGDQR